MSERRMMTWMEKLPAQTTVQLEIDRVQPENDSWLLGKGRLPIKRTNGSAWLQAANAARQQPVVIRDEVLGKLVLERTYSWFSTKVKLRGRRCDLSIQQSGATEDPARDLRDIKRARMVIAHLDAKWPAIEKAIVREMLPLYNDNWRGERRVVNAKQFLARIRHGSIVVGPTRVTMYFNSGGLFYEHGIEVRLTPRCAVSEICLAG
jgi:hypothetical protein